MSSPLSDHEVRALWQKARERLDLVDREPPISLEDIDKLLTSIGRRPANQTVADWIKSAAARSPGAVDLVSAVVVPFDALRHQFTPVVEFVRLAADDCRPRNPLAEPGSRR